MIREVCPHCKRPMNVFTIRMTKSLAAALLKIAAVRGPGEVFNFHDLRERDLISTSDYTNMAHLRYLGLVERESPLSRGWILTGKAQDFILGREICKWVKVWNRKIVDYSTETVTLTEVVGFYQPPSEWRISAERLHPLTESQPEFPLDRAEKT